MNVREAILLAADHIEANPRLFNFFESEVPDCGTPGCALGWIGHFLGMKGRYHWEVANQIGFASRLGGPVGFYTAASLAAGVDFDEWRQSATACARGLRRFADKHHPATERPLVYPNWTAMALAQPSDDVAATGRL